MPEKRILWIENQLAYSRAHLKVLQRAGYIVNTAASAKEGIRILRQQPNTFDLVLLDILMGEGFLEDREIENGQTGRIVYDVIRDDLNLRIPIIFITVIVDPNIVRDLQYKEERFGFQLKILHKPVRPSELLQTVKKIIHK